MNALLPSAGQSSPTPAFRQSPRSSVRSSAQEQCNHRALAAVSFSYVCTHMPKIFNQLYFSCVVLRTMWNVSIKSIESAIMV